MSAVPSRVWGIFTPRLLDSLGDYSWSNLRSDLLAGITVGIVAVPLAMAFAIASGLSPAQGLFTAVVAGFIISALGGSRYQIGGPTGAFVVIVYGVVQRHGADGLVLATLMAGAMLLLIGVSGLATLIKYIPYPVTTGFTTGIALIIFSSQMRDFMGLSMATPPAEFIGKWEAYFHAARTISPCTVGVGAASLAILIVVQRFWPRLPGALVVVTLGAAAAALFHLPIETIGQRFGDIPSMLPAPTLPAITLAKVQTLLPDAISIAALGAIESLLSAVVADGMTGDTHKPGVEIIGQGVANIGSALFGGLPATGAIARTATNIRAGAVSPVSGIIHALTVLAIMLAAAPLAKAIPLASLAAVLILVAWNMSELDRFRHLFRAPRSDTAVLLTTFALTVLVDLNVAIQVGFLLAALLFMKRMIDVTALGKMEYIEHEELDPTLAALRMSLPDVEIYELNGPFFFGVAGRLKAALDQIEKPPKVFILRMRHVPVIDATGLYALQLLAKRCRKHGTTLVLAGVREQPIKCMQRSGLDKTLGVENICEDLEAALRHAYRLVNTAAQPESPEPVVVG